MKKTLTINLWGQVYHIDEDAYQTLQNYLTKLENQFSGTEEGKEILDDVEARFAEIFKERLGTSREVVNKEDVDFSIGIIGTPEDFGVSGENKTQQETESKKERKTRRLFRNPDDRILGGVCSGLAAYFNIDSLIVRIILIITFFFSGPLIYLVLWIVIPEAKTTAQKLEMKGESVNLSNIEKNIKEEFSKVKENLTSKKTKGKVRNAAGQISDSLLSVFKVFFRIFTIILGVIFILIGTGFLIAFTTGIFFEGSSNISFTQLIDSFVDNSLIVPALIGLCLVFCIPIISLIITGVRFVFGIRHSFKYLQKTLGFSFLFGLAIVIFVAVSHILNFRNVSHTTELIPLDSLKSKILVVELNKNNILKGSEEDIIDFENCLFTCTGNSCSLYGRTHINIERTEDSTAYISVIRECRTSTKKEGIIMSKSLPKVFSIKDTVISLSEYFTISEIEKYHFQHEKITLYLPDRAKVFIKSGTEDIFYDVEISGNYSFPDIVGKTCVMTTSGLEPI